MSHLKGRDGCRTLHWSSGLASGGLRSQWQQELGSGKSPPTHAVLEGLNQKGVSSDVFIEYVNSGWRNSRLPSRPIIKRSAQPSNVTFDTTKITQIDIANSIYAFNTTR